MKIPHKDLIEDMLKRKHYYQADEDFVFSTIDKLQEENKILGASEVFLCYVNLVMPSTRKIAMNFDDPLLAFIRENKSDRFYEEVENGISYVSGCNTKIGVQNNWIYY